MCEDWWCTYHDEHFYDCECILEEWMDEMDGFSDLIHQYNFKIKEYKVSMLPLSGLNQHYIMLHTFNQISQLR
jgi:hypothetical protein